MVARSITSASIPSFANSSAAPKATFIILLKDTIVTSFPVRFTKALPMGNKYSSSGTSPFSPYKTSHSMNMTGSSSRIALFNKPLPSYGLLTEITFNPGILAYRDSKAVECWAPNWPALPPGPRNTIGHPTCPPLIANILEAVFKIWSRGKTAKFQVINSTIGRKPFWAAPTAIPAKPNSAIVVSMTLFSPNSSNSPWLTL